MKANFWDQYRKWRIDCCRELLDKGYKPGDWEVSECGSIYLASKMKWVIIPHSI